MGRLCAARSEQGRAGFIDEVAGSRTCAHRPRERHRAGNGPPARQLPAAVEAGSPKRRCSNASGNPDVARLAQLIIECDYFTGSILQVDGGMALT